ncbi:MAG: helix-turn-helix domain-containing protein [Treponema sp.]|jgi:transcriptional regulator with XRE-family HTH domain|nr:helix-turn-helix domain-containing protein [Treponema sp.]
MDLDQLFIRNVRKWRKYRGFSQKILAERCNAAHSYIRQIESGSGHPSFAFIGKLADALNIDAYQLFYDETMELNGQASQVKYIESIKADFLEKVNRELDTLIDKLKK